MITTASINDYPRLLEIWENATRATHHFLAPADFEYYKEVLPAYLKQVDLHVYRDERGIPLAFVGVAGPRVEMLFVDADSRGAGIGGQLLLFAYNVLNAWQVDVNEQNGQAREFYERLGFQTAGRSALDNEGRPYPLLHMERPMPEIILRTPRLILRKLAREDFREARKLLQDPAVMYAYEGAFSDEETREWMEKMFRRYREEGFGLWSVVERESGALIGQCGLTRQDLNGKQVIEVGYLFRQAYWHRGYATEAAKGCRDLAFERFGATEVYSIIRDTNAPSIRVALRNGMREAERTVKHYRGVEMPHIAFRVGREEVKL